MGRRRHVDMANDPRLIGPRGAGGGIMKHSGRVVPHGVNQETGRALWQASCSCGWVHIHTNDGEANASRALGRHLRHIRHGTDERTGAGTPRPPADSAREI